MSKPKRLNCLAIRLIETYRKTKSPIGSGHCKYYPTCSQYGLEAYTKFSFVKASFLTLWRILRCNPLARGGFDPVPLTKKEKDQKNRLENIKSSPLGDMASYLIYQSQLYPESRKTDYLKMLYQAYYGPQHFFRDTDTKPVIDGIKQEAAKINRPQKPYTVLGNDMVRIDLGNRTDSEIRELAQSFIASTIVKPDHPYSFEDCLGLLKELTELQIIKIPASPEENPDPPFSHSQEYKDLYDPHYRVMHASTVSPHFIFDDIKNKVMELLKTHDQVIIAIDGPAASRKSTLARYLSTLLEAQIIPADDFFLPPKLRTEKRLKNPGGNIHYERLLKEVLLPLKQGTLSKYRRFDCTDNSFKEVSVTPSKIYILEGVYSFHPFFQPFVDVLVFCEVDKATQIERLKERSTPQIYEAFLTKWLPLEKKYFQSQSFRFPGVFIIPQELKIPSLSD